MTRSNLVRAGLLALAVLVALRHVVSDWRLGASRDLGVEGDIGIYIGAINHLRSGGALYDFPLDGGRYGFTYPPFSAIVLRPLTWLDPITTGRVWLTVCVLVAVAVVGLAVVSRSWPTSVAGRLVVVGLAIGAFLGSVQVQSDLITGQVNLVLALLIILDVGRFAPERFRGALVGLAAAIKLTPLVVWGWYAATRQWRALAMSVGVFAGCVLLAWVVMPGDSRRFWTDAIFETERVGDADLRFNNSVMGALTRIGVDGSAKTVLWLLLGGALVLLAFWNAQRSRRAGDHFASAVLLGCAAVVATPVAWPHHQIWLPLAGIVLILRERWMPRLAGAGIVVFAYVHVPLTRWWDAHDLGWFFNHVDFAMFVGVCVLGLAAGPAVRQDGSEEDGAEVSAARPPSTRSPSGRRSPSAR
ncbi:glycosyltransferase 87 family protein [Nocardioides hwasunensis]|uniref:DUF2029 domain-containing protein n=1 Tax=Nocardioides hwasunensis TaxID=397258 RepID=A0ABR8MLV5_9ACTN|nr:glycosyltransferase 87 family protein [Nocardioides hwasunensis]MBD3917003.1 DUF2029 domain-containing protein [Nocardioides hwasunensis]